MQDTNFILVIKRQNGHNHELKKAKLILAGQEARQQILSIAQVSA